MSDQKEFEEKLASEQAAGRKDRIEGAPPIGMQDDGTIKLLKPGERDTWEPQIVGGENPEDDISDLDDEP